VKALPAAFLAAVFLSPGNAFASDRGPAAALAAIRHDLPILLTAPLEDLKVKPTVDWVVADQRDAVAMWHGGGNRGIVVLQRRLDRWWWRGAAYSTDDMAGSWSPIEVPGNEVPTADCTTHLPRPPSAQELLEDGFIDKPLAAELADRIPTVPKPETITGRGCTGFTTLVESVSGGYDATFSDREDYDATWFTWVYQAPIGSESRRIPGSNVYYSFTLSALPDESAHDMTHLVHQVYSGLFPSPPPSMTFKTGSTIDVWFPYVLTGHGHYLLSIRNVTPEIREVPGALRNNVLHFVLPAFTLLRGGAAQGQIDVSRVTRQPSAFLTKSAAKG
jgi:hypothetical protein